MPVVAALAGFRLLVLMLVTRIEIFARGRLAHARAQDIRMHVQVLCQRARLIMERLRDGTLRRHTNRRRPPKQDPGARNVAWLASPFPKERYWLPRLIEEIVPVTGLFQQWAISHDLPTVFAQAPQLRRALSPIFTMLGLRLPRAAAIISPAVIPASVNSGAGIPATRIPAMGSQATGSQATGSQATGSQTTDPPDPKRPQPRPAPLPPAPLPHESAPDAPSVPVHPSLRWVALLPG